MTLLLLIGGLSAGTSVVKNRQQMVCSQDHCNLTQKNARPFPIQKNRLEASLDPIFADIIPLGLDTRPDHLCHFHFFRQAQQQIVRIKPGDKLFLMWDGNNWDISQEKTNISLSLSTCQDHFATFTVTDETSTLFPKPYRIVFARPSIALSSQIIEAFHALEKSFVCGKDLLLEEWAKVSLPDLKKKHKIGIENRLFFLDDQECIAWNGKAWDLADHVKESQLIAQLIVSKEGNFIFEIWDASGLVSQHVPISLPAPIFMAENLEEMITDVSLRNRQEISCLLGNRKVILKEGDWWLKQGQLWKKIASLEELSAYVNHHMSGQLFVVKKMERFKDKVIITASLFNQTRTVLENQTATFFIKKRKPYFNSLKQESFKEI